MRIHISETTKKCLENTEFQIEFRGMVELKVLLVSTWRHNILKSKLARPAKFLSLKGVGTTKIMFFTSLQLGIILCI